MNRPDAEWRELEALLAKAEHESLRAEESERIDALLANDALLEAALDQLEVEALLRWQHAATRPAKADGAPRAEIARASTPTAPHEVLARTPARRRRVAVLLSTAAAALLAAITLWLNRAGDEPSIDDAHTEVAGWLVRAHGDARLVVDADKRVQLELGEVHASAGPRASTLRIATSLGTVEAKPSPQAAASDLRPREEFYLEMHPKITRLLVLAGSAALTNAHGSAQVGPGELAVATSDSAPRRVVARSAGDFGFALYRQLVREQPKGNVFFSPISISEALTAAAIAARGKTEEELMQALGIPIEAKRHAGSSGTIPIAIARRGHRALRQLLNADKTPEQRALREQLHGLRNKLLELSDKIAEARRQGATSNTVALRRKRRALEREWDDAAAKLKSYELTIANSVWLDQSYPFAPSYLATMQRDYGAEALVSADFAGKPEHEVKRINAWVKQKTRGLIPSILDAASVNERTRLVLLNAVYFRAAWRTPFFADWTKPEPFTGLDGRKLQVELMRNYEVEDCRYAAFKADDSLFSSPRMVRRSQRDGLYPGKGGVQVVELPYRGDDIAMLILLPRDPDGLAALEQRLDQRLIRRWSSQLDRRETKVLIPKWRAQTHYDLRPALRKLGVRRAFQPATESGGADLSRMTTRREQGLHVQTVVHRAVINVDEKGTEAAGVTGIAAGAAAPDVHPFVPYFRADRPFVYLIRDLRTGTILFLGRFVTP